MTASGRLALSVLMLELDKHDALCDAVGQLIEYVSVYPDDGMQGAYQWDQVVKAYEAIHGKAGKIDVEA